MLSEKMEKALNAQINAEFWSAYLYLSMSVDFSAKGMKGIANWFAVQYQEEQAHAQIFMNYILSRGGKVTGCSLSKKSGMDFFNRLRPVDGAGKPSLCSPQPLLCKGCGGYHST